MVDMQQRRQGGKTQESSKRDARGEKKESYTFDLLLKIITIISCMYEKNML